MQTKHRVLLFFLHLLALLALLEPIVSYFLSFSYKHLMLPVALLVAIVDWSTSPAATMSRVDRLLYYGVLTAVAGLVLYFTPFLLPRLPQFLDPTTHPVVGELMETAWSSCEIGLVLLCLFWRLGTVAGWIKAIAVGISGGGLLTFFLTYPIYMLGLHYIVDGFLFSGPRYTMLLIVTLTAAFIILVTIGPVAAWHAHSNALGESVLLGVLAGGVAGFVVMGILGAAFAGVVANIPLYPVALSRAGFTESQWVGKMALGVNQTYPVTMILFWILIGGGLLMGGLMTLFVNLGQKRRLPQEVEFTVWPIGITLVAYPSLILLIVVSVAILALLPEQLTIEFEKYNLNPGWNPEHTLLFIAWQSFVMIWIVQLAGLVWLWRFRGPYRLQRSAGRLGQIAGIMGILLIAALYWVNPEGTRYFGGNLIMSILTFFVAGRQLVRLPSTKHDAYRLPSRLSWLAGFAGGGLLSATFMHQFAASAFSLVQLDVSMMDVLQNETAPPPGLIWLEKSFHELFVAQADFYLLFLTGGILIGLGIGWAFAIWAPKRPLP